MTNFIALRGYKEQLRAMTIDPYGSYLLLFVRENGNLNFISETICIHNSTCDPRKSYMFSSYLISCVDGGSLSALKSGPCHDMQSSLVRRGARNAETMHRF